MYLVTIVNNSPVPAVLLLDLREKIENLKDSCGLDCLEVCAVIDNISDKDQSEIMKTLDDEFPTDPAEYFEFVLLGGHFDNLF